MIWVHTVCKNDLKSQADGKETTIVVIDALRVKNIAKNIKKNLWVKSLTFSLSLFQNLILWLWL